MPQQRLLEVSTLDRGPTGVDIATVEPKAFQDNWSKGLLCPERAFFTVSWIAVSGGCFISPHLRLSLNFCCSEAGLQHARYPAKPRECHMVPMIFTNTPLWLYFRSVRSSEKLVKL